VETIGEYELVARDNLEKLNQRINELIGQGWQLYGSPAVKGDYWAQAMVKPQEPIKRQANVAYSR
jgi:hypothetical protein